MVITFLLIGLFKNGGWKKTAATAMITITAIITPNIGRLLFFLG
jgi:hypothetical protein